MFCFVFDTRIQSFGVIYIKSPTNNNVCLNIFCLTYLSQIHVLHFNIYDVVSLKRKWGLPKESYQFGLLSFQNVKCKQYFQKRHWQNINEFNTMCEVFFGTDLQNLIDKSNKQTCFMPCGICIYVRDEILNAICFILASHKYCSVKFSQNQLRNLTVIIKCPTNNVVL